MKKSFTLIEVSVVIALIAVIASIAVPNVEHFLKKSRDAKRVSDMQVLTLAVEGFYDDNGHYPGPGDNAVLFPGGNPSFDWVGECIGARGQQSSSGRCSVANRVDGAFDRAVRRYINGPIPRDPLYNSRGDEFFYAYDPNHVIDWPTDPVACTGGVPAAERVTLAVLGFNQNETNTIELHRDTCRNGTMLNNAGYRSYYVIALPEIGSP
ncbi:MAG: prepilin-type N-terminal cleavage/methylation domain-containing protein [Candidatus Omnitrophica bacterium]|nr:prepilin-type N-terminal cleavage/methylation domain-containing protein [Candidatus Omnitrophota bacterium]MDD5429260.1 prepilin-type N-terminal cleavage/methylation domain-containing protein [Candidatus Omnitrophota bacterium]